MNECVCPVWRLRLTLQLSMRRALKKSTRLVENNMSFASQVFPPPPSTLNPVAACTPVPVAASEPAPLASALCVARPLRGSYPLQRIHSPSLEDFRARFMHARYCRLVATSLLHFAHALGDEQAIALAPCGWERCSFMLPRAV